MKTTTIVMAAFAAAIAAAPFASAQNATEKCYGVSKAGKNDCETATSSCAGTSKKDNQKDAWIGVPKGTCEKIVGGTLKGA